MWQIVDASEYISTFRHTYRGGSLQGMRAGKIVGRSEMRTVTLTVAKREAVTRRALEAFSGKRRGAHISFASADLLWKVLTAKRWGLLKAMTGGGALTLREAARRAGRDVKAVHGDVHALLAAGVLRRNANGKIEFPFDAVHVDFMLKAA